MKAKEVIELILNGICGSNRIEPTCDILVTNNPDLEITGIVTTFMATVDVINEAVRLGANFIITHEPTWFNGIDKTDWCQEDSVYLKKKELIEKNNLAIWRFHDHMHMGSATDYVYKGFLEEIGWTDYLTQDEQFPWIYQIPSTSLRDVVNELKEKLELPYVQIIGKPDMMIHRVGILIGGGSLGLGREVMPMEVMERNNLELLICGDITEWTVCAYINDAQQLGMNKAMIKVGHERTEEAGMKHFVTWLRENINACPVHFVDAKEPFDYL